MLGRLQMTKNITITNNIFAFQASSRLAKMKVIWIQYVFPFYLNSLRALFSIWVRLRYIPWLNVEFALFPPPLKAERQFAELSGLCESGSSEVSQQAMYGLFRNLWRLRITNNVLRFQYASNTKGNRRDTLVNVKFLYHIT